MHINIYFGDKPVILCDEIDKNLNEILHHPDAVFVDEISPRAMKSMLHEIKKEEFHAGVIWHTDLEKLKITFFKNFKIIEAAGGIVQNDKKNYCLFSGWGNGICLKERLNPEKRRRISGS